MEPPRPPDDIEMKNIIDKLAQFVARNGPEFEQMTKSKQENNPRFAFLWGGPYFNYYTYKVTTEQTVMRHKQSQALNSGPRPLMEIDLANYGQNNQGIGGAGGWGGHQQQSQKPPPPEMPPTVHLTDQIASLQASQASLKEQTQQSEQNLAAQWSVLQQNNDVLTQEAIIKAQEQELEDLSRATNISLSIFDTVLQPIIETCTKDSISSGKSWIFQNSNTDESNRLLASYLNFKVTSTASDFTTKLHIIYLLNDVLHHCVRKNNHELKSAFVKVVVPMYSAAACISKENEIVKLTKLVSLWETKSKFFDEQVLEQMKNYEAAYTDYKTDLKARYATDIMDAIGPGVQQYEFYKAQHEQFLAHAEGQIRQQKEEVEALQQEIHNIQTRHKERLHQWQQQLAAGVGADDHGGGQGGRRSRWDKTAPLGGDNVPPNLGGPIPGVPATDLTKPPPGFTAPPHLGETIPTAPYYDLPAGLMVPLIKFDDSEYRALDPDRIRLPPPQPPSDRLMAAVNYFYSPPSHDRPRDPEGWERLALYEWGREKQFAIRQKKEDIESGRRQRSPTISPNHSRESTPDQTVPSSEKNVRKCYRSRSRSRSRTRSRTRSRSRGSTPPRKNSKQLRKRSRSRSRSRSDTRSHSRSRTRSRSRSRSRSRKRSRSRSRDRDESPHGRDDRTVMSANSGAGGGGSADPFESFRKQRAGAFYTRMKDLAEERKFDRTRDDDA